MKHSSTDVSSSSPGQIPSAPQALGQGSGWNEAGMSWAGVSNLARSGPQLWPPCCPSTRTRAAVQSWAAALSVKLRTDAASTLSPSPLPSLASFLPPLCKGQAEGGKDGVSLPSIWCCMPLSGCQHAHSNEGCHQGYCMLELCLLLLDSLSFFILFVQDTGRNYTTATHQPIISLTKQRKKEATLSLIIHIHECACAAPPKPKENKALCIILLALFTILVGKCCWNIRF